MSLFLFVLLASLFLVHVCAQTSSPTLPQKQVDVTRPTPLRQVRPADGAALQAAIDAAVAGDEILLMPGATYSKTNGFNFNARKDGGWVILRTDVSYSLDKRIDRQQNLAKLTFRLFVLFLSSVGSVGSAQRIGGLMFCGVAFSSR